MWASLYKMFGFLEWVHITNTQDFCSYIFHLKLNYIKPRIAGFLRALCESVVSQGKHCRRREAETGGRRRRNNMAAGCAWFLVLVSVFICNFMKVLPTVSSFVSIQDVVCQCHNSHLS